MSSTTPKRGAELLRSATKKIQSARVLAGAAVGPKKDEPKEKEQEPYAGPLVSLLTDVCRSSGFAYGEVTCTAAPGSLGGIASNSDAAYAGSQVWIRPFRTHRDTDGSKLAQWEYHMHHSGYYFVNKDTFKVAHFPTAALPLPRDVAALLRSRSHSHVLSCPYEAVPGKTVPDEFLPLVGELTYTKGVGVVGYAWQVAPLSFHLKDVLWLPAPSSVARRRLLGARKTPFPSARPCMRVNSRGSLSPWHVRAVSGSSALLLARLVLAFDLVSSSTAFCLRWNLTIPHQRTPYVIPPNAVCFCSAESHVTHGNANWCTCVRARVCVCVRVRVRVRVCSAESQTGKTSQP
eukprot:3939053-Rhodomonas_salina.1